MSSTPASSVTSLNSLLGSKIKCTLDDGRTATGYFVCVDRLCNLILTNVVEERLVSSANYSLSNDNIIPATRKLSQAMIPGERLSKVEVDKRLVHGIIKDPLSGAN